jgi:hypothetical protein
MNYPIDKGIPIPDPVKSGRTIYPWHAMEIGDSFFVSLDTVKTMRAQVTWANRRHAPKNFQCRVVEENGVKGERIWRTA